MGFYTVNDIAIINGVNGSYGNKAKGANYGRNAAQNYKSYIDRLAVSTTAPNPDVFTKGASVNSIRKMEKEAAKLERESLPPLHFDLRYAPKMGVVKAFFARLFTGAAINKQALLGHSYEAIDKMQYQDLSTLEDFHKKVYDSAKEYEAMTVEEADLPFKDKAFSDINSKLTSHAFDVNGDGKIDISEEAVSTVIADVLSKDEDLDPMGITVSDLKKADGSYTCDGEDRMMAFLKEENLETASIITKDIHSKLKLDKAQDKFLKKL